MKNSIKTAVSGLLIGGLIGYGASKLRQPEYTLSEKNEVTYLKSENINKKYEINKVNDNFYLGDLEHNLQGVKDLAYKAGVEQEDSLIHKNNIRDELEKIVEEKYKSIKKMIK
ncbi:MAG: hypothetical protein ACOC1K_01900 [Nanoarchaeota archaeon]